MSTRFHGLAVAIAPEELAWREALRRAGYSAPPPPNSVHPTLFVQPGGDRAAAETACETLLESNPRHRPALEALAQLAQMRGAPQLAAATRLRLLQLEVEEMRLPAVEAEETLRFMAAAAGIDRTGSGGPPPRSPASHVRRTFDAAAESFDERLVGCLEYQAPQLVRDAFAECLSSHVGALEVLDAGCGTGLCGPLLRPWAARLTGVDLSPAMLRQAMRREIYDELVEADLPDWLTQRPEAFDLIAASDVFTYFGDLAPLLAAIAAALRPAGLAAFTVDASDLLDVHLRAVQRFAHRAKYVAATVRQVGLEVVLERECQLRVEHGQPVDGVLFAVRQSDADSGKSQIP